MRIRRPALLVKEKVYVAPRAGMRHVEIIKHFGLPADAQRGFVTSGGDFVGREEGARIAIAAGQVPETITRLHSEDLPEYKQRKGK